MITCDLLTFARLQLLHKHAREVTFFHAIWSDTRDAGEAESLRMAAENAWRCAAVLGWGFGEGKATKQIYKLGMRVSA